MADVANTPKRLTIGTKVLSIAAMSQRGELALAEVLKGLIEDGVDIWRRFKPTLDYLEAEKKWNDRAQVIEKITTLIAEGKAVNFDEVLKARRTNPTVLAREIYERAKPYHPDIELAEVEAVVTVANCGQLYLALEDALGAKDDPKATHSPSPKES